MATTTETQTVPIGVDVEQSAIDSKIGSRAAPKSSGTLKDVKAFDVTPIIGREFPEASLKEWLEAPNSDELIKDLAITSKLADNNTLLIAHPVQSPNAA
jgi:hypothetical protein